MAGAALLLGGCGSFDGKRDRGPAAGPTPVPAAELVADTPVKIGDPYTIAGTTYTPADIPDYDDVGYASWYGEELGGRPTANGETFNPDAISAAHKTLPLPSYVEVTALDTGRGLQLSAQELADLATGGMLDIVAKLKSDFLKERMQCRGTRAASISGAASGSISTGAEVKVLPAGTRATVCPPASVTTDSPSTCE